jgi:predicted ATPase
MLNSNHPLQKISLLRPAIKSWKTHPFSVPIIKTLESIEIKSNLVFFIGENGSGKSTLLEAIGTNFGFGKEGGSKNINYATTEEDSATKIANKLRLTWSQKPLFGYFLRSESFFNIASFLDQMRKLPAGERTYDSYGGISPHKRSHGESFLALFNNMFSKKGFYLLDEPEAALSPQRQLSFLVILHSLIENNPNVQFIIATHSPLILAYPKSQIFSFDNGKIKELTYKETEIYKTTSSFLANPKSFLEKLLD